MTDFRKSPFDPEGVRETLNFENHVITGLKRESVDGVFTPDLKAFIDAVIIPALVKEWLAENRQQNPVASMTDDVDNSPRQLSAEQGVTP